jgi:hypothetical protein
VDSGKGVSNADKAVDAKGIPIGASAPGPKQPRLTAVGSHPGARFLVGGRSLPEGANIHLDRAYDSFLTRERLRERGLIALIANKGQPAPLAARQLWVSERTNSSWQAKLAHKKKLVWCTERVGRVVDFWVAFSDVVMIVRRLIREGWIRYRREGRPNCRP